MFNSYSRVADVLLARFADNRSQLAKLGDSIANLLAPVTEVAASSCECRTVSRCVTSSSCAPSKIYEVRDLLYCLEDPNGQILCIYDSWRTTQICC